MNALTIDDLQFVKQIKGASSSFELQGRTRDSEVIRDIETNNIGRTKPKKNIKSLTLQELIVQKREKLDAVKSDINVHIYHAYRSMLTYMESISGLNESTTDTFKDMIVKNWNWFIEPKAKDKRKQPLALPKTDPDDEHFDNNESSFKKNKRNQDDPAPPSGPGGTQNTRSSGTTGNGGSTNAAAKQNAALAEIDGLCVDWAAISSYSSNDGNNCGWHADYSIRDDHFPHQGEDEDDSFSSSDDDHDDSDYDSRGDEKK